MRIGIFSDYYLAQGDGTAAATEISRGGLVSASHSVYIFCPRLKSPQLKEAWLVSFASLPGFIYPGIRLSWPFTRKNLAQVKKMQLDIIHIETPLPVGLFGLWAAKKLGIPVVISAHLDMEFMRDYAVSPLALFTLGSLTALICRQPWAFIKVAFRGRHQKDCGRRVDFAWRTFAYLAGQCGKTIAISQKIYDKLAAYGLASKLVLVPNGIDLPTAQLAPRADVRKAAGTPKDSFVLITASRLVREKRIDQVLRALQIIIKKNSRVQLWVLNDGPERSNLQNLAKQLGITDNVHFFGLVDTQQVFDYLSAADVFINPCLREVASLAILKAGLAGKPLLLFDKRLVEPLKDSVNGFFVKNPQELVNKVQWLITHPKACQAMGQASSHRIKRSYSVQAHTKGLIKTYRQVIKARQG